MKRLMISAISASFILSACSNDSNEETEDKGKQTQNEMEHEQSQSDDNQERKETKGIETVAQGLDIPWSIARSDDVFYLSERPGKIIKIDGNKKTEQQVDLDKEVSTAAEAGLLGFVLAPDFKDSKEAYAYYTYEDNNQFNRIVKLKLENDTWKEDEVLIDKIPSGQYHHGGRLKIGPDDKLYATTGDASDEQNAQDKDTLGGKILRINLDGSKPKDNPISNSYVYSYGHRNPQGIVWTPDGQMYASEHGNQANDEINEIKEGQNYGWPVIEGNEENDNMETPIFTSGSDDTWAPSGIAFKDGIIYSAALRGEGIMKFDVEKDGMKKVATKYGRIRDVYIVNDDLYFVSNNTDGRGNPSQNDDKMYKVSLSQLNS
ncbi:MULTISPECIES: PQQ-dependent sugar dehydrogenase [Mammaliicoccus]|uniref:PQQ-dependent sugar dehydrogenase n=1 Tax=Mammaliicoccus sciuri TaxID=1296 RepID=A0AAW5LSS3_MAMSC|nr:MULTISPECIES: sorbosone dehydrogenase family protein [Mammaliicoccus]MBG9211153.1 PQQ-dependent sugar dehydrogenase [Mammaliicoccus sciuri]MCD8824958.1 PQQ-dependent sugar dehydrogenase [Mammaliicoccus sciuri]MCJ0935863.1 PQQ-dependent sugar dehydrogenase [Mammaliicoccus sciuri]MCJ0971585.1 PQQ-dependent sugar dehydrogenase [Mammaliicoccus sciuri]MCQ9304688.1 PQQ-dependent sugar dehydrogenase [Mammaliicoccus sciuri]